MQLFLLLVVQIGMIFSFRAVHGYRLFGSHQPFLFRRTEQRLQCSESMGIGAKLLSDEVKKQAISYLSFHGWNVCRNGDAIQKEFIFLNFVDAFSFMTKCAFFAERHGHHPEWFNVYNKVNVTLTTHDCGGISSKDIEMAKIMDQIQKQ